MELRFNRVRINRTRSVPHKEVKLVNQSVRKHCAPCVGRTYLFGEPVHAADCRVDAVGVPNGEQEAADSYHYR